MFITKKLIAIILLLTINIAYPIDSKEAAYNTFYKYVQLAQDELVTITTQVKKDCNYDLEDMVWTSKGFARYIQILYQHQKRFLKLFSSFIKAAKDDAFSSKFEHEIYEPWKKTFKKNYEYSLATDDWSWYHDEWGWFHSPFRFSINTGL